jgi:hypothetical protein
LVQEIDEVRIYSLDEAIINAQFRIIPYLIIDKEVMVDSVCDFEYRWVSSENIRLHGVNSRRLGVNATAVSEGKSTVSLRVLKNGEQLFNPSKSITVHKSLDIELPTIIGQRQNAISTNLLLPPKSGIDLDSNIYATKMSECD